jgi:hypothetical protein
VLLLILLFAGPPAAVHAVDDVRDWPRMCPESNRFGVALPGNSNILSYDVAQLNAGWYHSFGVQASPPRPAGLGFVQTIRLSDDYHDPACQPELRACCACPTWASLQATAQANPGSLWLVGNEPDRVAIQDGVFPDNYALLYHDLYVFLKAVDPSCQVGIGGVVQPTPVRLKYLDMILTDYQSFFGRPMPVDVWNVHNYVLREKRMYPGCGDCWGADIPPGVPDPVGMLYEIGDHDSIPYWTNHLVAMRQWMADRGYRERPLIVSEYGILMPEIYGYDLVAVRAFLAATVQWMLTATDPQMGLPSDSNRLVQAWNWYSLDDKGFEGYEGHSHLFDPDTKVITPLGIDFGALAAPLVEPAMDLQLVGLWPSRAEGTDPVTMTMTADVTNQGSETAYNLLVRFIRDGNPAGEAVLSSLAAGQTAAVQVIWPDLHLGQVLQVTAAVDPDDAIVECNLFGNSRSRTVLVGSHWIFLPIADRLW